MNRNGSLLFRLVAVVIVAGLVLGAGSWLYRSGFSQGYIQGAAAEGGLPQAAPGLRGYPGYYPGWFGPRFGVFPFFPFFGCLVGLFFLFAFGGLFRWGLFGPRRWGYGGPGGHPWHKHDHPHGQPQEKARPSGAGQPERYPEQEPLPDEPEEQ